METVVSGQQINAKIGSPEQLSDEVDPKAPPAKATPSSLGPSTSRPVANMNVSKNTTLDMNNTLQDQLIHPISSLSPYQNK